MIPPSKLATDDRSESSFKTAQTTQLIDQLCLAAENGDEELLNGLNETIKKCPNKKTAINQLSGLLSKVLGRKAPDLGSVLEKAAEQEKQNEKNSIPDPKEFPPMEQPKVECPIRCSHPNMIESSDKEVYVHSIVIPCDVPYIWAFIAQCQEMGPESLVTYLRTHMRAYAGEGCRSSILARATHDLLNADFAKPVTDKAMLNLLNTKIKIRGTGLYYDPNTAETEIDLRRFFVSTSVIAGLMDNLKGTPGLVTYQKIVKVLGALPNKASQLLQNAIDCRFGPITDMAASVTVENVDYWMGKLKLTTTTQLVDQLFRSPSVAGKCAAIFQLLEIHDLLWQSIDMSKVHSLVALLYRFFAFLMKQAKAAAEYAKQGYEWVAAKFKRNPDEPTTFCDVDTTLPEHENDVIKEQAISEGGTTEVNTTWKKWKQASSSRLQAIKNAMPQRDYIKKFFEEMTGPERVASAVHIKEMMDSATIPPEIAVGLTNGLVDLAAERVTEAGEMILKEKTPNFESIKADILDFAKDIVDKFAPEVDSELKSENAEFIDALLNDLDPVQTLKVKIIEENQKWIATGEKEKPEELVEMEKNLEEREKKVHAAEVELMSISELFKGLEFSELGRRFLEWIKSLFSNVYKFFAEYPIVAAFMGVVYTILAFCGFTVSEFKNSSSKKSFMGKISASMKDMYYANRGKDVVVASISNMANVAADMMDLNVDKNIEEFKETITKIHVDVNQLVIEATTSPGEFVNNPNRMFEFRQKIKECEAQYTNFVKMSPTADLRHISPIWTQLNTSYQKLAHLWCKYMASSSVRQEPVVIWLYGDTMIGKSAFIVWLINKINEIQGTDWEVFHISKGPEYWNGFAQQKIIVIDDFASYIGVEGCLDALAVMNLATCAPYNPSMAALEEKGVYANPRIVIVLSNHPSVPLNCGITDLVAFERRRDIFAKVRWIEHEICGVTKDCEHFRKFKKKQDARALDEDNYEPDTFEHLTFELKNPICCMAHKGPVRKNPKKGDRADGVYYTLKEDNPTMESIDWLNLAQMICEQVAEKDKSYKLRVRYEENEKRKRADKNKEVIVHNSESVTSHWENKPNVMVSGPPGIGKSELFSRVINMMKESNNVQTVPRSVLHIISDASFDAFVKANFVCNNDVVVIDDLSSHLNHEAFPKLVAKFKERYDLKSESLPLWIVGANPMQLDLALEKIYGVSEGFDMFYRRFNVIDCTFKRKQGLLKWKFFSNKDIEAISIDKRNINEMVSYHKRNSQIYYTFDSITAHMQVYKPKLLTQAQITSLPTIVEFQPDAVCKLKCTSDEFVKNFLNKSGSISSVISFMTGEGAEFYSTSGIDKMDIGRKILTTYRNVKATTGCQYLDMYSFVLEAWTNGYFSEFKNHNYLMAYADISFYIRTVGGIIEAGIYQPIDPNLANLAIEAKLTKEIIESIDVAQVMIANLPPWFCLAMQCCAQVAKIGMTVVAAAYVVKQNSMLFRAQKTEKVVNEAKENYLDTSALATGVSFDRAVTEVNAPILYPKAVGHTGTRQHGTSVDSDPFPVKDYGRKQTDTPAHKPNSGGSNKRQPTNWRTGIHWKTDEEKVEIKGEVSNEVEMTSVLTQQSVTMQQAHDPTLPATLGAVMPNMVQLCAKDTGKRLCYGLMLFGRTGTTVAHLVNTRAASSILAHDYKGNRWPIKALNTNPEQDSLDFVIEDQKCPAFRNIVRHLTTKDFSPQKGTPCVLFTLNKDWFGGVPTVIMRNYNIEEQTVYRADEAIHNVAGYSYSGTRTGYSISNINTFDGDCGSILVVCDPQWTGKIIGIHTAASTTVGYARQIYREMYEKAAKGQCDEIGPIKDLDMTTRIFGRFGEFVLPEHPTDLSGHPIEAIGTIKQFVPATTKLWLSPMPYGPKLYEPSLLDKHDSRNPTPGYDFMYDEAIKWCKPRIPMSEEDCEELDHCFRAVGSHYAQIIKRHACPIKVLSKTESINKLRGSMKSNPVLLSSSPGYPWNVFADRGKKRFIDVDPVTGMRHFAKNQEANWLKNSVDDVIANARKEESSYCVFKVCLKDELVKLKKIYEEPKTRTIAAAPLHLVVACRMFFHTVHAAIAECWPDVFAKVGIDASSFDWHTMFTKMLATSELGFAFDYKGWDTCVPPEFTDRMWIFYDSIFSLCCPDYTPEIRSIIIGLYKNLSKFRFLLFQRVYLATGGVASGHPGTAIDNCIINTVNMYFAYRKIMKRIMPAFATWYYFILYTQHADYGDDIFVSVVTWLLEHFNGVTVSEELSKIGWQITSADKTKPIVPSIPLWECEFMSRGFQRLYGTWIGPLRESQVVKCTHYVTTTRSHKFWLDQDKVFWQPEILADMAFVCLKEMFLHGEEKFNQLRNHFIENYARLGIEQYVPMYEEAYDNFFGVNIAYQSRHPSIEMNLCEQGYDLPKYDLPEQGPWTNFSGRSSLVYGAEYKYSGSDERALPLEGWSQQYVDMINKYLNKRYNSLLVNVYPPGGEIPYHKDNEKDLNRQEGVACLTVEGDGVFMLRWKDKEKFMPQRKGTLYLLEREYLERWRHGRFHHRNRTVSFTFRRIEIPE